MVLRKSMATLYLTIILAGGLSSVIFQKGLNVVLAISRVGKRGEFTTERDRHEEA